jgi:hypothetical protein
LFQSSHEAPLMPASASPEKLKFGFHSHLAQNHRTKSKETGDMVSIIAFYI